MRTNIPVMWVASILINVGMWCERFVIIVTSLHRDFLPSSWGILPPTWVDISLFIGTIGLFCTLLPALPQVRARGGGHRGQGAAPRAPTTPAARCTR